MTLKAEGLGFDTFSASYRVNGVPRWKTVEKVKFW